jgi:hypothetical protein
VLWIGLGEFSLLLVACWWCFAAVYAGCFLGQVSSFSFLNIVGGVSLSYTLVTSLHRRKLFSSLVGGASLLYTLVVSLVK